MAWYRAGGGGIPSSLKTDMNDVLNKKFGTSQDYPPADWAPTVNLMGPLPEKTASGAIVTFSDGADAVPLKKCEVTLPASLDGYSEVDVVSAGKNLLDFSAFSDYSNWKTDITENQSYPTANANRGLLLDLPQGTYTVSFGIDAETYPTYLYLCKDDGSTSTRLIYFTGANFSTASGSFTVDGTSKYYFRMGSTGSEANFNSQIAKIAWGQIEAGSTASTFEPFSGTTHTADLGRTIYGGTADVVKGEGKSAYKKVVLDGTQPNNSFGLTAHTGFVQVSYVPYISEGVGNAVFVSDTFEQVAGIAQVSEAGKMWNSTVPRLFFSLPDTVTTQAQVNAYFAENPAIILYPIATPETFTFDPVPIDSKLGNNTIWSEQGSTEVTYRADINLALGGQ